MNSKTIFIFCFLIIVLFCMNEVYSQERTTEPQIGTRDLTARPQHPQSTAALFKPLSTLPRPEQRNGSGPANGRWDSVVQFLVGILAGIFTSLAAWYILFHILVSKIEFLPSIYKCRTDEIQTGWKYRIKFRNIGYRDALDLELIAKIRIKGLPNSGSVLWRAIYIPVDDPRIPRVSSHRGSRKRLAVFLLLNEIKASAKSSLTLDIQNKCNNGTITLEEIMNLGSESTLQVFGFAYDSFSGSRRLFESPVYKIGDIVEEPKSSDSEQDLENFINSQP